MIPFPRQLRVVSPAEPPRPVPTLAANLVEHDGRTYRLEDLLGRLTLAERRAVEAVAVWTAQGTWDAVMRQWPALAAEIAAAAEPVW